jgi:cytochrome c oxidase subunit 3
MSSITFTPVNERAVGQQGSVEAVRTGVWVGIFAITMSFMAFTSALLVREGSGSDWQHVVLPQILYFNTMALLVSSFALEMSRRYISGATMIQQEAARKGLGWLCLTLVLGAVFLAGQLVAWHQLAAQGIFLATNPNSSFFYVLTAVHGVHLFAGLAALVYLIGRLTASHSTFKRSTFKAVAIYWHFMGVLWFYLLLIFRTRL